ncbi:hypothetical protein MLD38_029880 [Melastoma candidum]|uniref:Uncharacterized protein n=1 Tax=Melastoma candidum TaxID=119954 RepID=A0ACB9N668_9MYRT|nr:hypothetical protein MLD38_029880 [Melastoma candidum]
MSWLRTAVSRAVEVGGRNNLTRTVRDYADTVVHHAGYAVAEGARLLQDRMGGRNVQNFRQAVKRLEEVSVSCRGIERVMLLRRWLVALKEVQNASLVPPEIEKRSCDQNFDDSKEMPRTISVYYNDPDGGGEPLNFQDVFLRSQALEGMTLSMILEAPKEEEIPMLRELFGLCLKNGKEVRDAVLTRVQDLARAFSGYEEEVLIKREELLQYAQAAIAGLKLNAELARIDAETLALKEKLDKKSDPENPGEESNSVPAKDLDEACSKIQQLSRMESLLLRKRSHRSGDSSNVHAGKVDKLKVLSESLANSSSKIEKRVHDNRIQKDEALNFRVVKTKEMSQLEKELALEIANLQKQKDYLEAEMKKVNASLASAFSRLQNAREEREQFDDASNQILSHLKAKEDELSRSNVSCRMEADIVNTWINFLEDTWTLQMLYSEKTEKQVNQELGRYGDSFVNLVIEVLSSYKEGLSSSLSSLKALVQVLGSDDRLETDDKDGMEESKSRRNSEDEFLNIESKFLTTLSMLDAINQQFYVEDDGIFRKDNDKVKELFDALNSIRAEFESIKRPVLEVETPRLRSKNPSSDNQQDGTAEETTQVKLVGIKDDVAKSSSSAKVEGSFDVEAELARLQSEFEEADNHHLHEEINDWEFDELEKEIHPVTR